MMSLLQQRELDLAQVNVVDLVSSWLSCLELGEEELGDAVSKTLGPAPGRRVVAGTTQNNLQFVARQSVSSGYNGWVRCHLIVSRGLVVVWSSTLLSLGLRRFCSMDEFRVQKYKSGLTQHTVQQCSKRYSVEVGFARRRHQRIQGSLPWCGALERSKSSFDVLSDIFGSEYPLVMNHREL